MQNTMGSGPHGWHHSGRPVESDRVPALPRATGLGGTSQLAWSKPCMDAGCCSQTIPSRASPASSGKPPGQEIPLLPWQQGRSKLNAHCCYLQPLLRVRLSAARESGCSPSSLRQPVRYLRTAVMSPLNCFVSELNVPSDLSLSWSALCSAATCALPSGPRAAAAALAPEHPSGSPQALQKSEPWNRTLNNAGRS